MKCNKPMKFISSLAFLLSLSAIRAADQSDQATANPVITEDNAEHVQDLEKKDSDNGEVKNLDLENADDEEAIKRKKLMLPTIFGSNLENIDLSSGENRKKIAGDNTDNNGENQDNAENNGENQDNADNNEDNNNDNAENNEDNNDNAENNEDNKDNAENNGDNNENAENNGDNNGNAENNGDNNENDNQDDQAKDNVNVSIKSRQSRQ